MGNWESELFRKHRGAYYIDGTVRKDVQDKADAQAAWAAYLAELEKKEKEDTNDD